MNELGGQITLNDIVIDFLLTPPVGADLETYLLENIDRDQFIDYLFINYGSELETVVSNLDGAYDEVLGNRILLNALTECQFKSCLKDNWDDIIGSDTSVIYEFVRYNDWVNVASGVFTSYPDSFTQAFAYLYSTNVASILENWHYSLYAFMDGIESFYGSGMKDKVDGDTLVLTQYVRMKEFHLYGASRLGILNQNDTLKRADLHYKLSISDPSQEPELFVETEDMDQYAPDSIYTLKQGNRLYEGSNHLGNVLVTFSDKRIGYCTNDTIYYYRADIRTANDYSAFGAPLDDRQWYSTADSGVYRFGFNGQEKDDEVSGVGNSNTAAYWQYDNRLGKRFNMDMIVKADESSYATFSNNPIYFVDYNGLTPTNPGGDDLNIGEPVDGPSMMDDGNSGGGHIIAKTAPLPKAGTSEDNRSNYGRVPSTYEGRLILGNLFNNLGNAKNYSPTNEELGAKAFREVRLLYNGSAVADHFMSNTGTPLVTSVPQSDNPNGPAWDNLISEIGTGLLSQYDGHNLSSINDIPISNPHFIGVGNVCMDISYAGILGGIQNTYVVCHNIKIIEKTVYEVGTGRPITVRGIQAEVQIVVSDWFGVSEDDYTKKMNSVAASQRGALAAFWALQHQRGYKPFVNVYTFRTTITKYEE